MTNFFDGSMTMNIILIIIVTVVIIFAIISSIMGRKTQKIEREKRKKQVKDKIKKYIRDIYNRKNLKLEYEKVIPKKGKEFKYRDIFDVIINIYEAKTNFFLEQKAFEIEGISKKISKKQYETIWIVNKEIDLNEIKRRIEINEKLIKLTKEEKRILKFNKKKNIKFYIISILKWLKNIKKKKKLKILNNFFLKNNQYKNQKNLFLEKNKKYFLFFYENFYFKKNKNNN